MKSREIGEIFSCSISGFIILFVLGFLSFPFCSFSQDRDIRSFTEEFIRCYTPEIQESLKKKSPPSSLVDESSRSIRRLRRNDGVTELGTIPVIVHVIHNGETLGEGMNIPYEQIVSQIEVLNEDFRKKPRTPGFNSHPDGADAQIEFCLATVDPEGNVLEEPGVNRINRIAASFSPPPFSDEYLMSTIQPETIWDPDLYLNIWVSSLSSVDGRGILGLAQLPFVPSLNGLNLSRSADTDGVSIHYKVFGREGDLLEPYTRGRTTTHEIGHFLGLIHIWGDGNCSVDDFCDDTPRSDSEVFGCPIYSESCGSRNMLENFMQYTDDVCMNIFTKCQVERMSIVMANAPRRASLFSSDRCQLPQNTPVAALSMTSQSNCTGTEIQFLDQSSNLPSSWLWEFEGGMPATSREQNPRVVYNTPGAYSVTLTVSNASGSDQAVRSDFVVVSAAGKDTFFVQDFESAIGDWVVDNPDEAITWELVEAGGSSQGVKSVRVQAFEYIVSGAKDRLITPSLDFRGRSNVKLSFRHAYRSFSTSDRDSLNVWVSTDGGSTYPFKVLGVAEDGSRNFATNAPISKDFVPINSDEWCGNNSGYSDCMSLDLGRFEGLPNIRVAFEVVNDFGNNIYIDDIILISDCPQSSLTTSLAVPVETGEWLVYPNPSTGSIFISSSEKRGNSVVFTLYNSLGKRLKRIPQKVSLEGYELNFADFPVGSYILQIQTNSKNLYRKVLIHR